MDKANEKKFAPRWKVIILSIVIFGPIIVLGLIDAQQLEATLNTGFEWAMVNFGWLIMLVALAMVIFCLAMFFHPVGKIKFGGDEAKPEFAYWNWFAMSLCAGIAIGIVFWGYEPLLHTMEPAQGAGVEAGSIEAMMWSMKKTFLHWTFTPYALYVGFGIVVGYVHYNLEQSFTASSALYPLLGERAYGKIGTAVDAVSLFAICGGVAGSLGYGILQLGSALEVGFGIEPGPMIWGGIAAFIVASYTTSSITGLDKGIRWLSDKNTWLFMGLLAFTLIFGPTAYILNMTTQSVGHFLNNFVQTSVFTNPMQLDGDLWSQWWDMYWVADWLSFAPLVGLFLVRLCYGRTIRQFVFVNLILPATFGMLWFGVFGSFLLNLEFVQGADMYAKLGSIGGEGVMIELLNFLPLTQVIRPIFILIILISFVTLADSMTSTVSMVSTTGFEKYTTEEPPIGMKLFWGIFMGALAIVALMIGGIDGVKIIKTFAGIPIMFLLIFMLIGFIKHRKDMGAKNNCK